MTRRLFSYPLSLAVVVAALVSATGGWIAWWNYRAGLANSRDLAGQLFDRVAGQTAQATTAFLMAAPPAAQASAELLATDGHPASTNELLRRFTAVLRANPGFAWVTFGDATGAFAGVHRIGGPSGPREVIAANESHFVDGKVVVKEYDLVDGAWRPADHGGAQDFDPRGRPWYKLAEATGQASWTEPYHFEGGDGPGITYATPVYEGELLRGVLTIDFDLGSLSALVRSLRVSEHGVVAIVSKRGTLIAHPTAKLVAPDGALATAAIEPGELSRTVDIPGSPGWQVHVDAPEADFTAGLRGRVLSSLLISVLAVAAAIAIAWLLARRVSRPLVVLAGEMREVGEFHVDDRPPQPSLFKEIALMNEALAKMRGGLRSFASYVPRDLVRAVLASGQEATLSGETRELTIYFSDLAGFTSLAETMTPDALVKRLGAYFDRASRIIAAEGGTVDKYLGDGIMAFWGAPAPLADHAARACLAALAAKRLDGDGLTTRIGIATGEVVVGNIGSPERLNYTVMGDPANLASRLEGLNKQYGTHLMIGESTFVQAKDAIVARPLDVVAVKGKQLGVRVYELMAVAGDEAAAAIAALSTTALDAYLARDFAAAAAAWDDVLAQRPGDRAATIMRDRARAYATAPPPDDWNGIFVATSK